LFKGSDVTIIAVGVMVHRALKAAKFLEKQGISCQVINMSTIKPIDEDLIIKSAKKTQAIVTAEDHNIYGGLGGAVSEVLVKKYPVPVEMVAINDIYAESGEPDDLAKKYCLNDKAIIKSVKKVLKRKNAIKK